MKYPQSEKLGLIKIIKHLIYSKGYGSFLSLLRAVLPPWSICLQSCTRAWGICH